MGCAESKQTATEASVSLILSKPNLLLLCLVQFCAPHTCFFEYSWESLKSELCVKETSTATRALLLSEADPVFTQHLSLGICYEFRSLDKGPVFTETAEKLPGQTLFLALHQF